MTAKLLRLPKPYRTTLTVRGKLVEVSTDGMGKPDCLLGTTVPGVHGDLRECRGRRYRIPVSVSRCELEGVQGEMQGALRCSGRR